MAIQLTLVRAKACTDPAVPDWMRDETGRSKLAELKHRVAVASPFINQPAPPVHPQVYFAQQAAARPMPQQARQVAPGQRIAGPAPVYQNSQQTPAAVITEQVGGPAQGPAGSVHVGPRTPGNVITDVQGPRSAQSGFVQTAIQMPEMFPHQAQGPAQSVPARAPTTFVQQPGDDQEEVRQ